MFKTIIIDTSADLRDMGSAEYLKQQTNRSAVMPVEYRFVNDKIDELSYKIMLDMKLNLVHIAQMKDEWEGKGNNAARTGKRIRKGYPNANFQADIRLLFRLEAKVDTQSMLVIANKFERKCIVVKNRFKDQASDAWVAELNPIDWKTLVTKLTDLKEGEIIE